MESMNMPSNPIMNSIFLRSFPLLFSWGVIAAVTMIGCDLPPSMQETKSSAQTTTETITETTADPTSDNNLTFEIDLPDTFVNSIGMRFQRIPAGTFTMGSPADATYLDSSRSWGNDEFQHKVTLTEPFYMSVYEVTQEQFQSLLEINPSSFIGDNHPVESVNYQEATEFCQKLTSLPEEQDLGRAYRLPTEAEWEYSCRAGEQSINRIADESSSLADFAWHSVNSGGRTHPVGQKQPNRWGLYDMLGNVDEWCSDYFGDYPRVPVIDPTGPESSSHRVLRGGCWFDVAKHCRVGSRFRASARATYKRRSGFRVVCTFSSISGQVGKPSQ